MKPTLYPHRILKDPQHAKPALTLANQITQTARNNTSILLAARTQTTPNNTVLIIIGGRRRANRRASAGIIATEFGTPHTTPRRHIYRAALQHGVKPQ